MSFSWEQRAEIASRANGIDEITGLPIHQGEAAHIDHTKNENYFDYDNNSLFVNAITHAWMHLIDEDPGLTTKGNKWSKNKILERAVVTQEEADLFGAWFNLKATVGQAAPKRKSGR